MAQRLLLTDARLFEFLRLSDVPPALRWDGLPPGVAFDACGPRADWVAETAGMGPVHRLALEAGIGVRYVLSAMSRERVMLDVEATAELPASNGGATLPTDLPALWCKLRSEGSTAYLPAVAEQMRFTNLESAFQSAYRELGNGAHGEPWFWFRNLPFPAAWGASKRLAPWVLTAGPKLATSLGFDVEPGILDETRKAFKDLGTEALAQYRPFHLYWSSGMGETWGIFLNAERILAHASDIASTVPGAAHAAVAAYLTRFVLDHELFHAQVELEAFGHEWRGRTPLYLPNYDQEREREFPDEETLAEHAAHVELEKRCAELPQLSDIRSALMDGSDQLPGGYGRWRSGDGDTERTSLIRSLARHGKPGEVPFERILPSDLVNQVPVYSTNADLITGLLRPAERSRALASRLRNAGFKRGNTEGSHEAWHHPDGRHAWITRKWVSPGIIEQVERIIAMSSQAYEQMARSGRIRPPLGATGGPV